MTAEDIQKSAGTRSIVDWAINDGCPPAPGCAFPHVLHAPRRVACRSPKSGSSRNRRSARTLPAAVAITARWKLQSARNCVPGASHRREHGYVRRSFPRASPLTRRIVKHIDGELRGLDETTQQTRSHRVYPVLATVAGTLDQAQGLG